MKRINWIKFLTICILLTVSGCGREAIPPATEQMVDADGVRLYVRVAGDPQIDDVIVAVHGGPGNSSDYMVSLQELVHDGFAVVSYDQRGTGRSSQPSGGYTLLEYVADLEAVREAIGVDEFHVLGHSWGGIVAMQYATVHPERVSSIILMDSGPPVYEFAQVGQSNLIQRVIDLQDQGVIPEYLPSSTDDLLKVILPAYFSDPSFEMPDEMLNLSYNQAVYEQTFATLGEWDFGADVMKLEHSVLILWGEDDPFGIQMADATQNALSSANVTFEVIDDCGHYWHECQKEAFKHLNRFLDQFGNE